MTRSSYSGSEAPRLKMEKSKLLFEKAQKFLVGGVNSPVRSFKAVGGTPLFISRARGSKIWDIDGNQYIDYVCSWGALILGAADPHVLRRVSAAAANGTSFGAPCPGEVVLAEMVTRFFPSMRLTRFVNSGTEAVMSALRLARAYTRRPKIVKFEGCYHGHVDALLAKAGSGIATLGLPDSAGIPQEFTRNTIVVPYNDLQAVAKVFMKHSSDVSAVIVEPVAANMGLVPPKPDFLRGLRRITNQYGSLLILDEVVTGFRIAPGGAQELYGIEPDLTCLGKILGGGLPIGAYGGREEIMRLLAPLGPVYQAGTLAGNPLAMAAGIETLGRLTPRLYANLEKVSKKLADGIVDAATEKHVDIRLNRIGSMLGLFFSNNDIVAYESAAASDRSKYARFFWRMLEGGVYLPPSPFETIFLSTSHSESNVEFTVNRSRQAFEDLS